MLPMQPDAKFRWNSSQDINKPMKQGCWMLFMERSCCIIHKRRHISFVLPSQSLWFRWANIVFGGCWFIFRALRFCISWLNPMLKEEIRRWWVDKEWQRCWIQTESTVQSVPDRSRWTRQLGWARNRYRFWTGRQNVPLKRIYFSLI